MAKKKIIVDETPGEVVEVSAVASVRCPDCPWKAGLQDEKTLCATCNGSGLVESKE